MTRPDPTVPPNEREYALECAMCGTGNRKGNASLFTFACGSAHWPYAATKWKHTEACRIIAGLKKQVERMEELGGVDVPF